MTQELATIDLSVGFKMLETLQKQGALTDVSLDLTKEIPDEQALILAKLFGEVRRRSSWWIGDLLIFAEGTMGEKYAQVAHETGLSEGALHNIVTVCKRVTKSRRRAGLPFSVHRVVMLLPPREQRKWLAVAERERLTERELRALVRGAEGESPPGISVNGNAPPDLVRVARLVWSRAQDDGDGFYRVPAEVIAQLRAALGED